MGEGAIETKADAHAMQLKLQSKMNSRAGVEGPKRNVCLECIAVILSRRVLWTEDDVQATCCNVGDREGERARRTYMYRR